MNIDRAALGAENLVLLCFAAVPSFEVVPLETVSETSSNASIGNLNGDGKPDIVLSKVDIGN